MFNFPLCLYTSASPLHDCACIYFIGERSCGSTDTCQRCVNCHWLGSDSWGKGMCVLHVGAMFLDWVGRWLACRLWVVPLLLSLSCATQKKTARKNAPRPQDFARPFFLTVFFCDVCDRLSQRGTTCSLTCLGSYPWKVINVYVTSPVGKSTFGGPCNGVQFVSWI